MPDQVRINVDVTLNDSVAHRRRSPATVDRLLHYAHVCQTTGDSVRLTLAHKGVNALS